MIDTLKTLYVLISLFFLNSQYGYSQNDLVVIVGKVENTISDSLIISNNIVEYSVKLNNDGTFRSQLDLLQGYYFIKIGNQYTTLFLSPSDSVFIQLDTKQFDESIQYSGTSSEINNYLAKKILFKEKLLYMSNIMTLARLEESIFLNVADSVETLQLNFLASFDNLPNEFVRIERKHIKSEKLNNWSRFESLKRYLEDNNDFKVSEQFPYFDTLLFLNDEEFMLSFQYNMFMNDVLSKNFREINNEPNSVDYIVSYLHFIDSIIVNSRVKDEFLMTNHFLFSKLTKSPYEFHQTLLKSLHNEDYKKFATKKYVLANKLKYMDKAPDFNFVNVEGDTVHLSDFRGKIIYIDIWATWCQPCIKELPHLKSLISNYKNRDDLVFISISRGDSFKNWKRFIKKNDLDGIQLFADNENHPFFTDFFVTGIPRFILIDKNGLVLDPDAKRPSEDGVRTDIDRL